MVQSTLSETISRSASQETSHFLCKPMLHYRVHNSHPATGLPWAKQIQSTLPSYWRSISILYSHTRLCIPSSLLLSDFSMNCVHFPYLPWGLHYQHSFHALTPVKQAVLNVVSGPKTKENTWKPRRGTLRVCSAGRCCVHLMSHPVLGPTVLYPASDNVW